MLSIIFYGTHVAHHVRRQLSKSIRTLTDDIPCWSRLTTVSSSLTARMEHYRCSRRSRQQRPTLSSAGRKSTRVNTTAVSNRRYKTRILPQGSDHGNDIKVHNQRDRAANWITVRCRLICIASSAEPDCTLVRVVAHGKCSNLPLFLVAVLAAYVYTCTFARALFLTVGLHQLKILSFTIQSPAPYSPCTGTWYGIPTWHWNWFATTLLAASAPPSTLSPPSPPSLRLGSPSYRCPDCQPVSGATRFRNRIPKIFPNFSLNRTPPSFSRSLLLFLSHRPLASRTSTLPRGRQAPREEQSAGEWEPAPPLILFPQTLRSRYFVAKDRSRDLRSSIALLS